MPISSILNLFGGSDRITAEELKAMMESKEDISIIDVRNPDEFSSGHIPGCVLIPLSELEGAEDIPSKGRLVLYCRSGVRSMKALNVLKGRGVKDAVDLKGGIEAWKNAGGPCRTGKVESSGNGIDMEKGTF
ncbi:MAG: rhodanese-like domain-containing protein [Deltaproteobacteria bacterium]|nr:rhodanese-like domain-containing protein [Deltaproteobacteria bacterium]